MNRQLLEYDKQIVTELAKMKKASCDKFGHKELAEYFKDDPRLFNSRLIRLRNMGVLKYKGWGMSNTHIP